MPGKKYKTSLAKVDRAKRYKLEDALALLDQVKFSKWDETVDIALRLGVDPKLGDQMVRGVAALPHGLGKKVRVIKTDTTVNTVTVDPNGSQTINGATTVVLSSQYSQAAVARVREGLK